MELPDQLVDRVVMAMGKRPVGARKIERGYTNAIRSILTFADGSSCFLKAAADEPTATWLRAEYDRIYSRVQAPFLAELLGWHDDGERPLLLLKDLSRAFWPPPWSQPRIESVLETIEEVRQTETTRLQAIEEGCAT